MSQLQKYFYKNICKNSHTQKTSETDWTLTSRGRTILWPASLPNGSDFNFETGEKGRTISVFLFHVSNIPPFGFLISITLNCINSKLSPLLRRQTTISTGGQVCLIHPHPQHWSSSGLCPKPPALLTVHLRLCGHSRSTTIVKLSLISDNDERAYLEEIKHLENWWQENNLLLNVSKTKELIVNCSKKQERHYQPVRINGTTVERVDSFMYLGVHILQDLSWSRHTNSLAKKALQRLYHLRRLRDFRLPSKVLRNFYTCTIESILTGNITVWF
ncbi:hypothetical protein P4O66_001426 [Electrophorus voltai]|uniref:Alkylated DNA repair protein AlkB homologue 8 N-terminal domain-containing protein n=1 Tax=Electrophorus voltai TaxID=2609070 RepID=A0AAD8Z9A0_9TELE|nr:hypothetical protein P4O66_001426 [Electrophorus voltai]